MLLRYLTIVSLLLWSASGSFGQEVAELVKWNVRASNPNAKAGQEVTLLFSATIQDEWKLYSSDFSSDIGPLPTEFTFDKAPSYALVGTVQAIHPKKTVDPAWDKPYTYFAKKAEFRQVIKPLSTPYAVKGTIRGLLCSSKNGVCIPFNEPFTVQ